MGLPGLVGADTVWLGSRCFDLCFPLPVLKAAVLRCCPSKISDEDLCTGSLACESAVFCASFACLAELVHNFVTCEGFPGVLVLFVLARGAMARRQSSEADRRILSVMLFRCIRDTTPLASPSTVVDADLCEMQYHKNKIFYTFSFCHWIAQLTRTLASTHDKIIQLHFLKS